MSTITKERAQQIFLGNGPEPTASEERELARIALASLEAEPVAWTWEIYGGGNMYAKIKPESLDARPLYTAQPAPVSVPDDLEMKPVLKDGNQIVGYEYEGERYSTTAGCAWNTAIRTFRAAMLQG